MLPSNIVECIMFWSVVNWVSSLSKSHLEFHVHIIICNDPGIFTSLPHAAYAGWLDEYNIGLQFMSPGYLDALQIKNKKKLKYFKCIHPSFIPIKSQLFTMHYYLQT